VWAGRISVGSFVIKGPPPSPNQNPNKSDLLNHSPIPFAACTSKNHKGKNEEGWGCGKQCWIITDNDGSAITECAIA